MSASPVLGAAPAFKSFAASCLRFNWQTGALLLATFSLVRFALVLYANITHHYQPVAFVFGAMTLLPFALLTRAGRAQCGLVWPRRWVGVLSCTVLFTLATRCFGVGEGNPLVYIAHTYPKLPHFLHPS